MLSIESAFNAYQNGLIDGWDLCEVVMDNGGYGFTITKEGKLIVKW